MQGEVATKNAIGYFGYAYYEANKSKLKAVKINGVAPSAATVKNGKYQPLSRPLFIYVSRANPWLNLKSQAFVNTI